MADIQASWKLLVPVASRPTAPQHARNWQNYTGVILRDGGQVAIFDGDLNEEVVRLNTGFAVHILRSSPTGRYFHAIGRDGVVSMIDLWTPTPSIDDSDPAGLNFPITASIPTAKFLHDGGFDHTGNDFLVAANASNKMVVVDLQTHSLAATIETGLVPHPGRGVNWEDPVYGWVNATSHRRGLEGGAHHCATLRGFLVHQVAPDLAVGAGGHDQQLQWA